MAAKKRTASCATEPRSTTPPPDISTSGAAQRPFSVEMRIAVVVLCLCAWRGAAVHVRRSEEESRDEEDQDWKRRRVSTHKEEPATTPRPRVLHPNDLIFPLILRQTHVNNYFKFGDNWYTWSVDKRADGTSQINYYICYDEPKKCDEVGWDRVESPPKCAFQIDSLASDDRVCIYPFGEETRKTAVCDAADQMKVSEIARVCSPRIRSLWRFVRAGRRPDAAAKPADVNSLMCDDEDLCHVSVEYRIHHDRITFSLHEPTRGQTYRSSLRREAPEEESRPRSEAPRPPTKKHKKKPQEEHKHKKKPIEGKGVAKEDLSYAHKYKNHVKVKDDLSGDNSEFIN